MAKAILINKAKIKIEEQYLEKIFAFANLPEGKICLVLHDNSLPENYQGVCIPSQLINFAPDFLGICQCLNSAMWDCCIAIAKKWCISRDKFPAYFSYLLGHELGHAYIFLSDIELHKHCCLVHDWINPASNHIIQFPHSLPHEQLCDRFGKYLSCRIYGDEKFDHEINVLKEEAEDIEKQHLEIIQKLSPIQKFHGLRESLIKFSMPFKDELIRYWKEDSEENGPNSLASLITDYDELFEH